MQSVTYSCLILVEHEFSRQIFGKHWSMKFHENTYRQTDRHDEANSRFSRFYVKRLKIPCWFFTTDGFTFSNFVPSNTEIDPLLRRTDESVYRLASKFSYLSASCCEVRGIIVVWHCMKFIMPTLQGHRIWMTSLWVIINVTKAYSV